MRLQSSSMSAPMGWTHAFDAALDALWPRRCLVCEAPGQAGLDLCADCSARLPWLQGGCPRCALPSAFGLPCGQCSARRSPITRTHAAFLYQFPLDRLLPRVKFSEDFCAAALLSRLMLRRLEHAERPDALIALPLHKKRLRKRGYNQALELARPVSAALDIPLRLDLLWRPTHTVAQSSLDREERAANMHGVFAVREQRDMPRHIALVDDVMTTGASLEAAAQALRAAGVQRVDAWVCARVE